jgi:hypothetical protein
MDSRNRGMNGWKAGMDTGTWYCGFCRKQVSGTSPEVIPPQIAHLRGVPDAFQFWHGRSAESTFSRRLPHIGVGTQAGSRPGAAVPAVAIAPLLH